MNTDIEKLLSELYETDPGLRTKETVLRPLLQEMIAAKPSVSVNPHFRSELYRRLQKGTGRRAILMHVPFWVYFPMAGAIVVLLLWVSTDRSVDSGPIALRETAAPEIAAENTGSDTESMKLSAPAGATNTMILTSDAFENGESIPRKYSCIGEGAVPPLSWSGVPNDAKSLALILHDIDAPREGGFTHWVVYDIPADAAEVKGTDGDNGRGTAGYIAPCPPSGTHQYVFTLYALDTTLDLKEGNTRDEFLKAAEGHILNQTELIGLFASDDNPL